MKSQSKKTLKWAFLYRLYSMLWKALKLSAKVAQKYFQSRVKCVALASSSWDEVMLFINCPFFFRTAWQYVILSLSLTNNFYRKAKEHSGVCHWKTIHIRWKMTLSAKKSEILSSNYTFGIIIDNLFNKLLIGLPANLQP